ncbi:hypothetical protein C7T94_18290 [Pedobacter yulinensis]|uniref:Peptidase A2 domain-containing protein n=1 Tax=Pedobacter yulinensis TaxID=2126353 RepID=A0A2T3HH98_9SPHI|nr:retropepsin-like aspartic protease [Pedobacter yulinensis]PST81818.1 hypothetical protein C7T94_18290 [Pedobacter yulinensis]
MKHVFLMLLALAVPSVLAAQQSATYKHTNALLKEKDFFQARNFFQANRQQMTAGEKFVVEAYLHNAFNKPALSNKAITAFLDRHAGNASDSLKMDLQRLKMLNHVRLFEYADALRASNVLELRYSRLLSAADLDDYRNTAVIWKALSGMPGQEVIVKETTTIRMKRDKAKLANLEVKAAGVTADFIFDTGANFSTVSASTAKALGMKMLDGTLEVGAITGGKVKSGLAVCPAFSIGNIMVKNAVFLVFPDSSLAFPQIQYQINGIIGFPVIEGLKEVQLTRNDDFIVPKEQSAGAALNMALDFLTPVINLGGEHFTFDTGATGTMLYSKYLRRHQAEITGTYEKTDLQFGGAGGMLTKKGYKIIFRPLVSGRQLELPDVHVFDESLNESKDHFYGNIGQDVIRQFDKMTLNFGLMFIAFK